LARPLKSLRGPFINFVGNGKGRANERVMVFLDNKKLILLYFFLTAQGEGRQGTEGK
jgi:hypothetical protein